MIKDSQKFSDLVQEVRTLIDSLQDITKSLSTTVRQEGMLRYGIQQIKDPETLSLVSEICLLDYPDISDAASIKIDVLNIATDKRQRIQSWANSVKDRVDLIDDEDLEELTMTELKDMLRRERQSMIPLLLTYISYGDVTMCSRTWCIVYDVLEKYSS